MDALAAGKLDVLERRVALEVERGALPSAQFAVGQGGGVVGAGAFGDVTPATRFVLQSCSRLLVAGAVWKLISDGGLRLDEHVADVIPEFGSNGKDVVTVEQVLTHVGGFPLAPIRFPDFLDRDRRLAAFAKWRLTGEPGRDLEYHLTSAGWVIAELVERRTGMTLRQFIAERIADPLSLELELGPSLDHQDSVAMPVAIDDATAAADPWGPWFAAQPEVLAGGEPSHAIVSSASDLVTFLQGLYHSGLWDRAVVDDAVRPRVSAVPAGMTVPGAAPIPVTLGLFVTVADDVRGKWAPSTGSRRSFGESGAPCQFAFHDPDADLSFAFLTNGYPTSGYDTSRRALNRIRVLSDLAGDLLS